MGTAKNLLSAIGFGAGCMYLYDPQCGKRRRAVLRDRLLRATRRAGVWLDRAVRDAENRIQGTAAELEALFDAHPPSNEKLEGRVRAQLGHVASHPHLVQVRADNGRITLTGNAPLAEMHAIIAAAYGVRGVCSIDNRLDDQLPPQAAANPRRRAPRRQAGGRKGPGVRRQFPLTLFSVKPAGRTSAISASGGRQPPGRDAAPDLEQIGRAHV